MKEDKLSDMFYKDKMPGEEKVSTLKESISDDPRIVSPEIQVLYPAVDEDSTEKSQSMETKKETTQVGEVEFPPKKEETKTENEPHTCSLSLEEAVKQHWVTFTIAGVVLVGLGFLIGKSKSVSNAV